MAMHSTIESSYDAVVVGARVAGASTAMLLARSGLRVLVLDRSARGSDTTSTHALMRAGVLQLHRWGLLDRVVAAGTPAIRLTTFHYGDEAIEVPIQARDGVDALYAPRRTVLDTILADAAAENGARVVRGALVERLLHDRTGRVCGVEFRGEDGTAHRVGAGIVIGADGAHSSVARAVGAPVLHTGNRPGAYIYGYWKMDVNGTHWHFGNQVAAGVIPTNDGHTCVFAGLPPARYEGKRFTGLDALFKTVLAECDRGLARTLSRTRQEGKLHPFRGLPGFIRQSWGPGWALVGDAACFKDPLTAHGMTDALRDAELLANAVAEGTDDALAAYQSERDGFAVEFLQLSDEIASFGWDNERVKGLHHRLSKLMARECDWVNAFGGGTPFRAGGARRGVRAEADADNNSHARV
jgi:2-polyprenyl-6-methoxyphenol hydroxylase-like FAD-dependent oxidoreductase